MTCSLHKLGIGSSQFPLDPLHVASRGRPPHSEVRDILDIAARAGLGVLDVAGRSAHAESLLGQLMPPQRSFRLSFTCARPDRGLDAVETGLQASLARLGTTSVDTLLAPSVSDLFGPQGEAFWERMQALREAGLCRRIGFSVLASDDPVGVCRRFRPDVVQAPASLLDQRLLADGTLARLRDMGVEVHLRPIFLNSLLFLPPDRVPAQLRGAAGRISRARRLIAEGRSDPLQAALGFALSRPEAAAVLVGVSSAAELSAVVAAASRPPPDLDWDDMALDDPALLDRRHWAA